MQALIEESLDGKRGPDQQRIAEVGSEWLEMLLRKNADYGSSVWKVPLLTPGLDPGDAILVRMTDKIERIARLRTRPAEVVGESLADSMRDLGAYCLLWLARPRTDAADWHSPTEADQ